MVYYIIKTAKNLEKENMTIKRDLSRISIDIPMNLQKKLKASAAIHGKSMREIVIESIEKQLQKLEAETTDIVFK